jgi:uncharacterized membrane protein required for colicin V production
MSLDVAMGMLLDAAMGMLLDAAMGMLLDAAMGMLTARMVRSSTSPTMSLVYKRVLPTIAS